MKKYLLIMQSNPYANSKCLEGLEFAFAITAFSQHVTLIFKDDGVLQIFKDQEVDKLIGKDFTKAYAGLDLFEINEVYTDATSLQKYAKNELLLTPKIINADEIATLISQHDVVLRI